MSNELILNVAGVLLSIIGLFFPIYHIYERNRKVYRWKEVQTMVIDVARKIKNDKVKPDLIVATGRGGAVIGALLSYEFESVPLLVIDRKYISHNGRKSVELFLTHMTVGSTFENLKNGTTLLVTSKSDPGITLNVYKDFLESTGFSNIIKCALLKSKTSIDYDIKYCFLEFENRKSYKEFPWSFEKVDVMK